MELANVVMNAFQIASFIGEHRDTLRELNFQEIQLRTGIWDDALAPSREFSCDAQWRDRKERFETMSVPVTSSPVKDMGQGLERGVGPGLGKGDEQYSVEYSVATRSKSRQALGGCWDHMKWLSSASACAVTAHRTGTCDWGGRLCEKRL